MTIPEGAQEGDVLTFTVNGQELEIPVPIGSQPGDVLSLQIGNDDEPEEDDDQVVFPLDLGNGNLLELERQLPQELQNQNAATTTSNDNDNHDDDTIDDGTYALPWQSGKELSKIWKEIAFPQTPKRILELGSGALGVVGLSFAVSLQDILPKAKVVLTDVPSAMPLLQYNLEQVKPLLLPGTVSVEAKPLEWTLDHSGQEEPHYDCLLGSDLLYNAKFIPHLVATARRLLHPTRGIFVLAVRWRKPELERDFFQDSGLEWKLVQPSLGALPCTLNWNEFGDPNNAKSNLYFHQTQISVQGNPKALADITEEESGKLDAQEFEAWDRAHIQIYMGTQAKS